MRWLFVLLIAVLVTSNVLSLDMSLAPGLSAKNAVLYAIAMLLVFRAALGGLGRLELPVIHVAFAVMLGYGVLTWLIAGLAIDYSGYDMIDSGITLKADLFDPAIVFLATFYGTRDSKDVTTITAALAFGLCVANVFTIADVAGFIDLGIYVGSNTIEVGRVFGVFGHANDTGTLIVCLLPAVIAVAMTHKRTRPLWLIGALASLTVLIMTVSRGAFVGLIVGCSVAALLCRRFIPLHRIAAWGALAAGVVVLAVGVAVLVSPELGNILSERIVGQTKSIDTSDLSSGRTTIWAEVIARMMLVPITLLTGYGWDSYWTFPFRYAAHNYYLSLWFNLGLPGLLSFLVIMVYALHRVLRAIANGDPALRPYLLAFVFATLSMMVSVVFTNLSGPWIYVWLYIGVTLRAALLAESAAPQEATSTAPPPPRLRPVAYSNLSGGRAR